jgi:DNA-binding NtrC family response regulator
VRELRNFVERSVTLGALAEHAAEPPAAEDAATPDGTADGVVPVHLPLKEARVAWMDQFERRYADALLRKTGGNVTRAAEMAGVHRRTFQRLLASLGRLADASEGDGDEA